MALNLTPLMADLEAIRRSFGCRDEALLRKVIVGSDLPDDDTDAEDYELEDDDEEDDDTPEELPSSQDALRHIIMGEPCARGIASKYGWAFLALCQHFGEELDHTHWGRTRAEYIQAFDQLLASLAIGADVIRMGRLSEGGGDFPFPSTFTSSWGTMEAARVASAVQVLASVDRTALETASHELKLSRGDVEPEFVVACFDELHGWCQRSANAGKGLIVFCG